jgi:hypothetical protein
MYMTALHGCEDHCLTLLTLMFTSTACTLGVQRVVMQIDLCTMRCRLTYAPCAVHCISYNSLTQCYLYAVCSLALFDCML